MHRRTLLKASAAAIASALSAPAIAQGNAKVLRCAPEANLASIDPIWTTATVAINHGYMVYDTLFGVDLSLTPRPQMAAGHTVSDDGRTWTITLRDGLFFHDGEKVRSADCIASIDRWSKRSSWGQALGAVTQEMTVKDDKTFTIQLKKPFALTTYALGVAGCFIMPERVAKTDPFKQITETVGSGPFKFVKEDWVAGAKAAWVKNDKYIPRDEPADFFAGGKRVYVDRVEHTVMPDGATAAAALQTGEVDWVHVPLIDLVPMLKRSAGVTVAVYDPLGWLGVIRPNFLYPPFDNRKLLRAILPAIDQREFLAAVIGEQSDLGKLPAGFFTVGSKMANMAGLEALSGPRDVAKAKRLVAESGYKGEPVLLMSPTDQPALAQVCQVTRDVFEKVGIKVDYQAMDWSTLGRTARLTRVAGQGRLECILHILVRIGRCRSRRSLSDPWQRQRRMVRLADRSEDGGAARLLVRRARPADAAEDLRGHADLRLRAGSLHSDRTVVLSDRFPQHRHRYRPVAEHPALEPEEELTLWVSWRSSGS